jgi:MoaA/NifB/PqqE/SkfB family radical SAM enzyme
MARFYITFRCNSRCGYCNVWQDPVFFGKRELSPDELRRSLDQVRELGVTTVDFTGGEPALHRHLSVAVRHAKALGLHVELTTNAIRFANQSLDLVPHVDTLNISLDTLSAAKYHAIRGVDTLDRTVALVEALARPARDKLKIISVVSGQTLPELPTIVAFAQAHEVPVYLSPMFTYFREQGEVRDPARTARTLRLLRLASPPRSLHADADLPKSPGGPLPAQDLTAAVRSHAFAAWTVVDLSFLRRIDTVDPATVTDCAAGSRIITIGPDGGVMLPCYHEWDESLAWDRPYSALIEDRRYLHVRDNEVGKRAACRACTVFPYQGLATSYRVTVDFLVQALSQELTKVKAATAHLARTPAPPDGLLAQLSGLLAALDTMSLRPGHHLDELYHFEADADHGVRTDLAATPVPVHEVLADHACEDGWGTHRTPHRLARLLYTAVLPGLVTLARTGNVPARDSAAAGSQVHLALWAAWLQLFHPGLGTDADGSARRTVWSWCALAGAVLREADCATAARSAAALGLLFAEPPAGLERLNEVVAHREYPHLIAWLTQTAGLRRRADLLPYLDDAAARVIASTPAVERAGEPDLPLAASGDIGQLDVLTAQAQRLCARGDTAGLRGLIRRWKAIAPQGNSAAVDRHLMLSGVAARLE